MRVDDFPETSLTNRIGPEANARDDEEREDDDFDYELELADRLAEKGDLPPLL